jgi:integrase
MDRPAGDVTTEDFESAFSDMPPGTKEFRIRRLRVVLNYAVRKGLIEKNAANALDLPAAKLDEIHSYSAGHVERMLRTALSNDRPLLPYLAVCAFCGLRPEREAYHLDWSDVHLDDDKPEIVVSPELSKTRRRRFVEISANCAAWIRASRVERVGRVMPYPESTFNKRRRENRKQAGVPLIADGLRHAFCSAHLAYHGDLNRLLLMSGHTNPQILWRHYYRHFSKDEAQRYWSITP